MEYGFMKYKGGCIWNRPKIPDEEEHEKYRLSQSGTVSDLTTISHTFNGYDSKQAGL